MIRSYRFALALLIAATAATLSACDFFHTPVDDVILPQYDPYLTIISFLEPNADTTFILVAESKKEGVVEDYSKPQTHYDRLGCIPSATVTLTNITTGQKVLAVNDYDPDTTGHSGLYIVKHNELPIIPGHEYELCASYKNIQPATATCRIDPFSSATFDYKIVRNEVVVTLSNVDKEERYYYACIKTNYQDFRFLTTDAKSLADGNVTLTFKNNFDLPFFSSKESAPIVVDTCIVYEINHDAYRYFKKVEAYRNSDWEPLSKPIYQFSNVDQGQGIFATKRLLSRKQ